MEWKKRDRDKEGWSEGPENLSSEFLILRNRRRIPERFHSGPAISGISLAPFPGTPATRRARVNGLYGFTDSCSLISLALSLSFSFASPTADFAAISLLCNFRSLPIRSDCYRIHSLLFPPFPSLPTPLVVVDSPGARSTASRSTYVALYYLNE